MKKLSQLVLEEAARNKVDVHIVDTLSASLDQVIEHIEHVQKNEGRCEMIDVRRLESIIHTQVLPCLKVVHYDLIDSDS